MSENIEILSSQTMYSCRVFDIIEEKVRFANGVTTELSTVRHRGAVVIVPKTDDGRLIFIRQYRHALGINLLEFPAGGLGIEEKPELCANRELAEETGFAARKLAPMGILYPTPGFCSEVLHTFVATDLYEKKLQGDEDEFVSVVLLSTLEVEDAIRKGEIQDSKSIALFYKAKLLSLI